MTVMVGLNIVIAVVLAFTAALSVGASIGMRGNKPMAWFAIALLCGSMQTLIMTFAAGSMAETLAAAVLAPAAYLMASTGIRAMVPAGRPGVVYVGCVAALSTTAVALIVSGAPYFLQLLTVQIACAVPVIDAAMQMVRRARRTPLDLAIVGGLSLIVAFSVARIPILLLYFGPDVTPAVFRQSVIETVLLSVSGLLVPPVIFLLLARNIGDRMMAFQRQSERDGLTGVLNRRGVDMLAAQVSNQGGAVIFCDIDHFKLVNDRFGHQAGDEVIRALADILARAGYPTGRMGGEEFSVILSGRSVTEAVDLAEMFRARFSETRHPSLDKETRVSASFGVAVFLAGTSPQHAFPPADKALYGAKRNGRNRVVSAAIDEHDLRPARQVA